MTGTETCAVNQLSGLGRFVAKPKAMTHCSVSWPVLHRRGHAEVQPGGITLKKR
jgi:hypothetical protein